MRLIEEVIYKNNTTKKPIWLMRQAGRYLPEFREIRKENPNFINLCLNETLVPKITLQPLERFNLNAAIIFSDILMIPFGLGQKVDFKKNFGPLLGDIKDLNINNISNDSFLNKLRPVYNSMKQLSLKLENKEQNLIGFVPQNIFLSERTILENIAYGINKDEINVQRVKDICTIVKLDELIESSPNGLDTLIGERGAKISGGQQQRMGIARAIYKNPKILIFDEATNALDVKTESEILNSIKNLNKNITIIMITHRLEIIKKFDKIIFLENGLLVDEANYDNLYNKNINFKKLVDLHNMDKKKN